MYRSIFVLLFLFGIAACHSESNQNNQIENESNSDLEKFDQSKWQLKQGKDHPFREQMVEDILYNDSIRALTREEMIELLGEPDYYRTDSNFLHYRIDETKLGFWTLHTKTMVCKYNMDGKLAWIKIHE